MNVFPDPNPTTQNQTPDVGKLGEQLVAGWLQAQGWVILYHRWRCRWGEIDLIACSGEGEQGRRQKHGDTETRGILPPNSRRLISPSPILAFVEVKTRKRGNWDADGRLAITLSKQAKLWQTAELFLAEHPDIANLPCKFDVALVSCQRLSQGSRRAATNEAIVISVPLIELGQPIVVAGYQLILQDYIQSAFP